MIFIRILGILISIAGVVMLHSAVPVTLTATHLLEMLGSALLDADRNGVSLPA